MRIIDYWPSMNFYQCDGGTETGDDMVNPPGINMASCSLHHIQSDQTNVSSYTVICEKNLFVLLCIQLILELQKTAVSQNSAAVFYLSFCWTNFCTDSFPLHGSLLFLLTDLIRELLL